MNANHIDPMLLAELKAARALRDAQEQRRKRSSIREGFRHGKIFYNRRNTLVMDKDGNDIVQSRFELNVRSKTAECMSRDALAELWQVIGVHLGEIDPMEVPAMTAEETDEVLDEMESYEDVETPA